MTEVKGLWQTTSREWDELITYSEVRLLLRHTEAPLWTDSLNLIWLGPGLCWKCLIAELIIRLSQKPSSQLNCIVTSRHKLTLLTCCLLANCANCWALKHSKNIKNVNIVCLYCHLLSTGSCVPAWWPPSLCSMSLCDCIGLTITGRRSVTDQPD